MALIEGVGDEVLICVAILFIVAIILFAWTSTWVRPLFNNGSVWMVHMQTAPERRVLEVYSLDEGTPPAQRLVSAASAAADSSNVANTTNDASVSIANTSTSLTEESDDSSENLQPRQQQDDNQDHSVTACAESPRRRILMTTTAEENEGHGSNVEVVEESELQSSSGADTTTIKLKFLDDTQKLVATWLSQTVGEFKRQHFETDVSQGKVVRLIYQGQLLRDDSRSLASYGLHDNCVLHCHVSTTPYDQQSNTARRASRPGDNTARRPTGTAAGDMANGGNGLDLGRYIYFIFAFKFAALWSAWFVFPEYFSRTSLVSLILCSGLFMLFWYGSQRRRPTVDAAGTNRPL